MSNRTKILVPKGIRFISNWKDYQEKYLYRFPHILDKQIPGCGYTEWCIRSKGLNVILCSPRRILLQNKTDQHPGEVFYARNNLEVSLGVDKDLNAKPVPPKEDSVPSTTISQLQNQYITLKNDIEDWWMKCITTGMSCKILVTYDSYYLVKDILEKKGIFDSFQTVVDEFQSIFTDAVFKSDTELKFIDALKGVQRVVYVSATPMMSKYLQMIPEFSMLPAYELDWKTDEPNRVSKPDLDIRRTRSITESIKPIIEKYKSGNFPYKLIEEDDGKIRKIQSKEMVIYVNSVKNIISIIKHGKLLPEETNILCADTLENRNKIKDKLGKDWNIGRILTKKDIQGGQQQKMFTLCTRTVYLGADFYSDNAKSYILSDSNIDCLAVDISLDLPQILGRQRLENNPWKNSATFFYMLPSKSTIENAEKLKEKISDKLNVTNDLLVSYTSTPTKSKNSLGKAYEKLSRAFNYKDDYVSVNRKEEINSYGQKITKFVPIKNNLVHISDERAYEIQRLDYKDRFSVFNSSMSSLGNSLDEIKDVEKFVSDINNMASLQDKLKFVCESSLDNNLILNILDNYFYGSSLLHYYRNVGPDLLKKCSYNITRLKSDMLTGNASMEDIKNLIISTFKVGEKYSLIKTKELLDDIYKNCGYTKVARALDIESYLEVKQSSYYIKNKDKTRKKIKCYIILRTK